ncbi:MAG: nitrilase-related carbon-nitrogen hydrolase, partial [bacterium]
MKLTIAMAQLDATVGAIGDNAAKAVEVIRRSRKMGMDMVVFPEMFLTGYPTNDLLFEEGFVEENERALHEEIVPETGGIAVIMGFVRKGEGRKKIEDAPVLYNCAAVAADGKVVDYVKKTLLPNYDVFDEKRYFTPGEEGEILPVRVRTGGREYKVGVQICEDLWDDEYPTKVTRLLYERGSDFMVNVSASPFYAGKAFERERLVRERVRESPAAFVYVNTVGGQDDLVFDGRSFVVDREGKVVARAAGFEEEVYALEMDTETWRGDEVAAPAYVREEEILKAHVLNLRDYFVKQGIFKGIVVGLSGGVDSAYTAYVASQAVGG